MKNVTMILAMVAVLAMAGTTFADFEIGGWDVPFETLAGGAGGIDLDVYILTFDTTTGSGPATIQDISISGVHQLCEVDRDGFGAPPTMFTDDFYDAAELDDYGKYDTHFLFASDEVVGVTTNVESNDGSNPAMLPEYQYIEPYGMGDFSMLGANSWGASNPRPSGYEFMRVVLPAGGQQLLTYSADVDGAMVYGRTQMVGVPEPSTILMLIVGGLSLLAVRFRK